MPTKRVFRAEKNLEFFSAQKKSIEFFSLRNRFLFRAESMHKCEHVTKTVFIFCLVRTFPSRPLKLRHLCY